MNQQTLDIGRATISIAFLLLLPFAQVAGQSLPPVPPEIEAGADEWPMANHDYGNSRAAMNAAITSDNVAQLGLAWQFPIPGQTEFGAAASAPLIADGVVYFQDLAANVFAFDLATGSLLWEHRYDSPVAGPNGPGLGYGKVFVASSSNTVAALDAATGEEQWSVSTENPTGAIQPSVYDGLVYVTTQSETTEDSYAGGRSGHILALDQATGEIVWDFQTVEAGFWGNPELNGGAGVFYPPAIDLERGLTFWGTGNPVPFPGTVDYPNGSSRPGPNLYSNSLLALAHSTGELVWYTQVRPHDIYGFDFPLPPVLASVSIGVEPRDIVIGAGKLGRIIAFDRATGEILWDTAVGKHQNDDLTEIPLGEMITVFPGARGGVETPIASADGTVYAAVNELGTEFTATGFDAETAEEAAANIEDHTPVGQGTSQLMALDAATGEIQWMHDFQIEDFAGATVVNDLVFTATLDGVIHALAREDGREVWSYQTSSGITAWPAVSGDTILFPAGAGEAPVLIALRLGAASGETDEGTPEATDAP